MFNLKKYLMNTILTIGILLISNSNFCYASDLVQVNDVMGANTVHKLYNEIATKTAPELCFSQFEKRPNLKPSRNFTTPYVSINDSKENHDRIIYYVNDNGFISQIILVAKNKRDLILMDSFILEIISNDYTNNNNSVNKDDYQVFFRVFFDSFKQEKILTKETPGSKNFYIISAEKKGFFVTSIEAFQQ